MPRTNSAAKKAARAQQNATGTSYMQAARDAVAEPTDWIVQLGPYPDGSNPYDFVLRVADGNTFGFVDYGRIVGTTATRAQADLIPFREHRQNPRDLVGRWLVTADRFTGTWSTWSAPIKSVTPASPRAGREALYGGLLPAVGHDAERLRRRDLADAAFTDDGAEFDGYIAVSHGALTTVYTVEGDRSIRLIETGTTVGIIEGFEPPASLRGVRAPTWEEYLKDPSLAIGQVPVVWASDSERADIQGEIVVAEGDA